MKLSDYKEKIKTATPEELIVLNNEAIADDEISAKEFGQVKIAVDNRKRDLNVPAYATGQRMCYDDQD